MNVTPNNGLLVVLEAAEYQLTPPLLLRITVPVLPTAIKSVIVLTTPKAMLVNVVDTFDISVVHNDALKVVSTVPLSPTTINLLISGSITAEYKS